MAKNRPLQRVFGTGIFPPATMRTHVDDIERLVGYSQLLACAGPALWMQSSKNTERYASITKRGPCLLRTALVQAGWAW